MQRDERSPLSAFDVCVIGHVTKDIFKAGEMTTAMPGGTAYYTSVGLKRFGLRVAVVTKVAQEDEPLLLRDLMAREIAVFSMKSNDSSAFENIYSCENLDSRLQRIRSIGAPFSTEDIAEITATLFHVGPLTNQDISVDLLKHLSDRPGKVSLDVQGMLRPARMGEVREEDWPDKKEGLGYVDILKADEKEARLLSGQRAIERAAAVLASLGPKEVIVTMGSRGSLLHAQQTLHRIPSFAPRQAGYPTGCGDTYMAGYLYERLQGVAPEPAARFAAAAAALKMEDPGPFGGSKADVQVLLSRG